MEKNYEYRKKQVQKLHHHEYKCDVSTLDFFCAYKCAEKYQLKRHSESHWRAVKENKSESSVVRFYEFPHAMLEEINGIVSLLSINIV